MGPSGSLQARFYPWVCHHHLPVVAVVVVVFVVVAVVVVVFVVDGVAVVAVVVAAVVSVVVVVVVELVDTFVSSCSFWMVLTAYDMSLEHWDWCLV